MNNHTTHTISKHSILKRMLRIAANQLGVKRVELLDPLAVLFVQSLAEEIYTISSEIGNIESRMLDKLAGLIAPDISLSAMPAHCILHAMPQDGEAMLSAHSTFALRDEKLLSQGLKELSFYPLCNTKIRKGGINYMVYNGLLYQVEQDQSKTLISRSRTANPSTKRSLWVGLELDESINSLKNLSFYVDLPGVSDKDVLLDMLPHSVWKLNGTQLNLNKGIYTVENSTNSAVKLFETLSTYGSLHASLLQSYAKYFLTVTDDIQIELERKGYPNELKDAFPAHILEDLTKPLVWLEIELPAKFSPAIIETIQISINAFPVINKTLHSRTTEIHESLPVIPLGTDNHESLLAIHSIADSEGNAYSELPFNDTSTQQYRTYSLRRGGYERYSKREMREYLLDLVRKMESHAAIQNERKSQADEEQDDAMIEVRGLIKHVKGLITKDKDKLEILNYILIDDLKKSDVFFVKYWTTNSVQANNIRQHTLLEYNDTNILINFSSVFTLSSTKGGKYAPQVTERRNLHLKSLTDRSMLVTNEDIIDYCKKNFASTISHAEVVKGVMPNPDKKQQFLRTKDVILTPRKDINYLPTENDIELFRKTLQVNSPATFNYRVIIK